MEERPAVTPAAASSRGRRLRSRFILDKLYGGEQGRSSGSKMDTCVLRYLKLTDRDKGKEEIQM